MLPRKIRENLQERDFSSDQQLSRHELGSTCLKPMVITRIDVPRPDRQDFFDLLIENYPPNR